MMQDQTSSISSNATKLQPWKIAQIPKRQDKCLPVERAQLTNGSLRRQLILFNYAIVGILLVSSLLQCYVMAKSSPKKYNETTGHPCICNGTFHKSCPKSANCVEAGSAGKLEDIMEEDDPLHSLASKSMPHDDFHPDHIDIQPAFGPRANDDPPYGLLGENKFRKAPPVLIPTGTGRIVRHRKFYMSRRDDEIPTLRPISISIPLEVEDYQTSTPPVYEYRKYTTIETKPEIQMVPVTKTIIRPANLSAVQILDENGRKVTKDFDVRKL